MNVRLNASQAWGKFRRALDRQVGPAVCRDALGASNGPFVMADGFRFGLFNLDRVTLDPGILADDRPILLRTRLILPPGRSLCMALEYGDESREALTERVEVIRQIKGDASKVRVYLHRAGTYLRQDRDIDRVRPEDSGFGKPVIPTAFWVADPEAPEGPLSPVAAEYVAWLENLMPLRPPVALRPRARRDLGDRLCLVHIQKPANRIRLLSSIPDDVLWEPGWEGGDTVTDINRAHPLMRLVASDTEIGPAELLQEVLHFLGQEEATAFENESTLADLRLRLSRSLRDWAEQRLGTWQRQGAADWDLLGNMTVSDGMK